MNAPSPGALATIRIMLNLSGFCLSLTGTFLAGVFAVMQTDATGLLLCLTFIGTAGLCFRELEEAQEAAEES